MCLEPAGAPADLRPPSILIVKTLNMTMIEIFILNGKNRKLERTKEACGSCEEHRRAGGIRLRRVGLLVCRGKGRKPLRYGATWTCPAYSTFATITADGHGRGGVPCRISRDGGRPRGRHWPRLPCPTSARTARWRPPRRAAGRRAGTPRWRRRRRPTRSAATVTLPATVPAPGLVTATIGAVVSLATMTLTLAAVVVCPRRHARRRSGRARRWPRTPSPTLSSYGAVVSSAPSGTPSSMNCTPTTPISSDAVAATRHGAGDTCPRPDS